MSGPNPKRRRLRFSLRSLLISFSVVCVVLGWIGWRMEWARRDQSVLADLRGRGVGASFVGFDMSQHWAPDWLKQPWVFIHFCSINRLEITSLPHIADSALPELSRLPKLRLLKIESDLITDEGLKHLAAFKDLQILGVSSPQLTDDGILFLSQFQQLEELAIEGSQLTPEGIERLQQALPHCRFTPFAGLDPVRFDDSSF